MAMRFDPLQQRRNHPAVDRRDIARLLRRDDHLARGQRGAIGRAHAQQHFEVQRFGRLRQRHDRLHHEKEARRQSIAPERLDEPQFLAVLLERRRALAIRHQMRMRNLLRLAARAIRMRQRVLHAHAARTFDQPDRRLHLKRAIADLIRRVAQNGDEFAALRDGVVDRRVVHHADELVAADAHDRIIAREMRRVRAATCRSTSSPLRWPNRSLTSLSGPDPYTRAPTAAFHREMAFSIPRRFSEPVSGSCSDRKCRRSTAFERSVVSCNDPSIHPFERIAFKR